MRTSRLLLTLTMAVSAFGPLSSCTESSAKESDQPRPPAESLKEIGEWTKQQWNDFVSSSSERMDSLNERWQEFQDKAAAKGEEVSDDLSQAMDKAKAEFQRLKEAGQEQGKDAVEASREAFNTAEQRLNAAWDALQGDSGGSDGGK